MSDRRPLHPSGVSLPLVITLLVLLMIAAATAHQLIMRSLKTADNIEKSSRAYFAAEAGLEDALYELSAHLPGYETPDLEGNQARQTLLDASSGVRWDNQWDIKNVEPTGDFSGAFYAQEKLKIHFFEDNSIIQVEPNVINTSSSNILAVDVSGQFNLTFSVPFDEAGGYSSFFESGTLSIDNDGDLGLGNGLGPEGVDGLNEDGKANTADCGDGFISQDGDCDGSQNEDSPEDPVLVCQIYDDSGRTWQALDGCLSGIGSPEDPTGSEICEKDFSVNPLNEGKIEVTIDQSTIGKDLVTGLPVALGAFIAPDYEGRPSQSPVTMECLVVAPLIQVDTMVSPGAQKRLPHLEYAVNATVISGSGLPLPTFTIRSDGWYRDFKQSITTRLTPRESVPLLDITIIQQN